MSDNYDIASLVLAVDQGIGQELLFRFVQENPTQIRLAESKAEASWGAGCQFVSLLR